MRHYLSLQYRLLNRHIQDFGLPPFLGWILSILLFVGLSHLLFHKTILAGYVLLFAALSGLMKLSGHDRNEFLQSCFSNNHYYRIRLLENVLLSLPFMVMLIAKAHFLETAALGVTALVLAFIKGGSGGNFTIPTPFGKNPFEFVVGFRRTFYLHILAYFIAVMSVVVHNFNLGIFSLLLVFLVCLSYYSDMEPDFYIWSHAQQPRTFLTQKIKWACIYSNLLALPIAVTLSIFFNENITIIMAGAILGSLYLAAMILAKYSAYPNSIGLPESFLLAFSLAMPPMLLVVIPFFYTKSIHRLALVLR